MIINPIKHKYQSLFVFFYYLCTQLNKIIILKCLTYYLKQVGKFATK